MMYVKTLNIDLEISLTALFHDDGDDRVFE